jgi:acyl-CoA oxidase
MDYLTHQRRLLPLVARAYAFTFAQQRLVADLVSLRDAEEEGPVDEQRRRRLETDAAGHKALATWFTTRALQEAREACGGFGYLSENRIAQLRPDLDVYTTFEGDNTVLLQLVAKGLLTAYRDEFGDMDPLATVRYVVGELAHEVADWANVRQAVQQVVDSMPGRSARDALLDHDWQLGLLRAREEHLVGSVARRLRSLIADGHDPASAFNWVQDHVVLAARAHVERRVLESFAATVAEQPEGEVRELLAQVCDLHALSAIEADRGWFMEHDLLASNRSKAIVGTVNALCRTLRDHAERLVDAFGIPEELLHAPIAQRRPGEHVADARQRVRGPHAAED